MYPAETHGNRRDAPTDLLVRMNRETIRVPLSWVATTETQPNTNFGDGLSAVVVTALSGIPVVRANFDEARERIVGVGTIGHAQKNGIVHFWGTGVDATRNPVLGSTPYTKPPHTEFHIHATRGPNSAATLNAAGIPAPAVYGDPVWVLPRFWPLDDVEKTHDLGVILHITELEAETPEATVKAMYERYSVPEEMQGRVKLINTYCAPTASAMRAKVAEIVACRRILSTSLHGLVISETYRIPCAWFATYGPGKGVMLDVTDKTVSIDHRIRDFYAGIGRDAMAAYLQDRKEPTDWTSAISFVDNAWTPVTTYSARPLLDAFPVPLAVDPDADRWNVPDTLFDRVAF